MGDEELAEICGIHAGDGYLRNKNYNRELDISGSIEEKVYYEENVIPLFSRVFGIEVKGRVFPSRGTYGFVIRERQVIEKLHELGFPYGKKSQTVRIPEFIYKTKNMRIKSAFLRGLFDTDGSIYFQKKTGTAYCEFKRTHHFYPVITMITTSISLHEGTKKLLNELRIKNWTDKRIYRNSNWADAYRILVKGTQVINWMTKIGISNQVKLSRFEIWRAYGHCPSKTSYAERLSILAGKIKIDNGPVA